MQAQLDLFLKQRHHDRMGPLFFERLMINTYLILDSYDKKIPKIMIFDKLYETNKYFKSFFWVKLQLYFVIFRLALAIKIFRTVV